MQAAARQLMAQLRRVHTAAPAAREVGTAVREAALGPSVTRTRKRDRFCTGPYEQRGAPRPVYPKRHSPFRRSAALVAALEKEEGLRMVAEGRAIFPARVPAPRSGDIIRVTYVASLARIDAVQCFMGIVVSVKNRGLGSTVVLRNVVDGVPVERGFPMYSPLIRDAEVLGSKKVRRNKLYYLREKPLRESTFGHATRRPRPGDAPPKLKLR